MDGASIEELVLSNPSHRKTGRRVAVIVLGMHRSGTSALARMLSLLGCGLPRNLLAEVDGNALGHWESDPVRWFNEELLSAAGTYWNDWLPVNPDLAKSPVWPSLVERGRAVIVQEFGRSPLFVLKDPRICRLVGFWLEVLAAEKIEPAIVIPIRNPLEVAASLKVRNGIEEGFTLLTWLRHVLEAEASTRSVRRIVSHYDELLCGWEDLAVRLEQGLRLSWPSRSPLIAQKIDEFLAVEHRHHVAPEGALKVSSRVAPWVADTYAILHRWTQSGINPSDYPTLDAIMAALDEAAPAFARLLLAANGRDEHIAQLVNDRDDARSRLADANAQVSVATESLLVMTGERDGALGALAEAGLALEEARVRLTKAESDLGWRDEKLSQAQADAAAAATAVGEALERANRVGVENLGLKAKIVHARSELDAAQGELAGLREDVGRLREDNAAVARAQWLADVQATLSAAPRCWRVLPQRWRRPLELERLRARRLFDAETYLRKHSDVAGEGADPLNHYISFGMAEGRDWRSKTEDAGDR